MVSAKCRSCDSTADAGAYCNSCAAGIMAKALNPFIVSRRKKSHRPELPRTSASVSQRRPLR